MSAWRPPPESPGPLGRRTGRLGRRQAHALTPPAPSRFARPLPCLTFQAAATLCFYNLFADGRHVSTLPNIGQNLSFPIRFQAPRGEQEECRRNEIEAGSGYYGVTQRLGPETHMHGIRQRSDQWGAKANPKKIVYE